MAFTMLRYLLKTSPGLNEKYMAVTANFLLQNNFNLNVIRKKSDNAGHQINPEQSKKSNLFEQARKYSEKSMAHEKSEDISSDSESDDDKKIKSGDGIRGAYTSDFWRRKIRTVHSVLDINNDGIVSIDDFLVLSAKFHELGNLTPEQFESFKKELEETWRTQWGIIDQYNIVYVDQYLTEMMHVVKDKQLRKKVHGFLPYLFQAVDKDHNGVIDFQEFALYFKCLGLSERDAANTFVQLDRNKDGLLSLKHFVKYGRDFFLTEDERRISKCFWGPLVQ